MTNEFTNISFCVFMNHEKKMQSSAKKKPKLIDRFDPCLSCLKKKEEKKRNISVSTVHTFSPVLSALSGCQSPASSNSVITHSHFPVKVGNPISLVWFLCCVFDSLRKRTIELGF